MVKALLKSNASVAFTNQVSNIIGGVLDRKCIKRQSQAVRGLLQARACSLVPQGGLNALHMACIKGNVRVVEALLEASADQSQFCLKKGLPSDLHIALNARTKKVCTM